MRFLHYYVVSCRISYSNIGIIHIFHASLFAGSRGSCLNSRPLGRGFKHIPRDPANVTAMKQKCIGYFPSNSRINCRKIVKIMAFCTSDHSVRQLAKSNVKTQFPLATSNNRKSGKIWVFRAATFCSITSSIFTQNMFKRHANFMI